MAPGSIADRAGLEPGDLVTRVDGLEIGYVGGVEFPLQSELRRAGPTVVLDVIDSRSRRPMTLELHLDEAGPAMIRGSSRNPRASPAGAARPPAGRPRCPSPRATRPVAPAAPVPR